MCQLCTINNIASRDRWPKPLEHHKADINFLVSAAHDEFTVWKSNEKDMTKPIPQVPSALLDHLRFLSQLLKQIEQDRKMWWRSPEKREQRQQLIEDCDQRKLSQLHTVNNKTVNMIEGMGEKLWFFAKWTLGDAVVEDGTGRAGGGGKVQWRMPTVLRRGDNRHSRRRLRIDNHAYEDGKKRDS